MSTKLEVDVAKMQENIKAIFDAIGEIKADIANLRVDIRENYVTKEELAPLKRFIQGMQGALVIVLTGILILIIRHAIPEFGL